MATYPTPSKQNPHRKATLDNTDCDDTNAAVNPGATEVCNGIDDNCDGQIDECCAETNVTNVDGKTNFTATSGGANVTGNFSSTLTGWVNVTGITNATDSPDVNGSNPYYGLGPDDQIISGVIVNVSNSDIESQLADGNGTIRITICYDDAMLGDIDPDTLAIWKYNSSAETWEKQLPSTIDGTCVYADVTHLCTFALVGRSDSGGNGNGGGGGGGGSGNGGGGGGSGTYPPGWGKPPASTPAATTAPADAAPESTVASTEVSTEAPIEAPPTEAETKEMKADETTKMDTKGTPGFGALLTVFAIAGLLVATYLVMRRRE